MDDQLPHDDYVAAVAAALTELGCEPANWWTSTPDGQQLDGVIDLHALIAPDQWPGGVYLGWDQTSGWSLTSTGPNRNLYDLGLDAYANPRGVAVRTRDRLRGTPDAPADEAWDGADALRAAIVAWEA